MKLHDWHVGKTDFTRMLTLCESRYKQSVWQYFKEIHSIVIQFAFGNPTGVTVNWFYFV